MIGLGVLLNIQVMLSVMHLFVSSVFVLVNIPLTCAMCIPELCIMLTFFRYSGRFLLTY